MSSEFSIYMSCCHLYNLCFDIDMKSIISTHYIFNKKEESSCTSNFRKGNCSND